MINIAIVDDHPVVRAGLREFLEGFMDLRVVGEAANGHEAIDLLNRNELDLDVLLLDLMMPTYSGQDALARIKCKAPNIAVLVLSGYPEELYCHDTDSPGGRQRPALHLTGSATELSSLLRAVRQRGLACVSFRTRTVNPAETGAGKKHPGDLRRAVPFCQNGQRIPYEDDA
jgi:DNA-binding NarL/FixJ family response regulator